MFPLCLCAVPALAAAGRWGEAARDYRLAAGLQTGQQQYRLHHKAGQCEVRRRQYTAAVQSFQAAIASLAVCTDVKPKVILKELKFGLAFFLVRKQA